MSGLILIDNYDSFTYNIVQYLKELGCEPIIFENDKVTINGLKKIDFDKILISPGAGNPDTAGISLDIISEFYRTKKILGVCLGHQCLAQFFGAKVIKAKTPVHGKTSQIHFDSSCQLFHTIPQDFKAARYHSLIIENIKDAPDLKITAKTNDNIIMALEHKRLPLFGVQFHPEAILTEHGKTLLNNFLSI